MWLRKQKIYQALFLIGEKINIIFCNSTDGYKSPSIFFKEGLNLEVLTNKIEYRLNCGESYCLVHSATDFINEDDISFVLETIQGVGINCFIFESNGVKKLMIKK